MELDCSTPYSFLVRFIKASVPDQDLMEQYGFFLAELSYDELYYDNVLSFYNCCLSSLHSSFYS